MTHSRRMSFLRQHRFQTPNFKLPRPGVGSAISDMASKNQKSAPPGHVDAANVNVFVMPGMVDDRICIHTKFWRLD